MSTVKKEVEIIIRKPYDRVTVSFHQTGRRVEDDVRLKRDGSGNCMYQKVGEIDTRKYINSFKTGCALSTILDRIQLMPIHDKISYLNQTPGATFGDFTDLPIDGTEAVLLLCEQSDLRTKVYDRMKAGETFDAIIKDMFSPKSIESEVKTNGEIESGNS